MSVYEPESIETNFDLSDPSAMLFFVLMLSLSQYENEIVVRNDDLYEKISDGHYRKISVTLDQIQSALETIMKG